MKNLVQVEGVAWPFCLIGEAINELLNSDLSDDDILVKLCNIKVEVTVFDATYKGTTKLVEAFVSDIRSMAQQMAEAKNISY